MSEHGLVSPRELNLAKEMRSKRNTRRAEPEVPEVEEGEHVSATITGSSPLAMSLCGVLRGVHWEYQKRLLDQMEILCHSDRQWQVARRIAQDIQNEQVRRQEAFVRQFIAEHVSQDA